MRYRNSIMALAALLALGGVLRADDTVVLTDGTVITGQVMQESQSQVVIQDNGVQRTFDRSLVSKVEFDTTPNSSASSIPDQAPAASAPDSSQPGDTVPSAPAQDGSQVQPQDQGYDASESAPPAGDAVPAPPDQDEQDYAEGVAGYYQVPEDEVWGYEEQGIAYEELPVVFYVARRARCAPGLVASLRLSGLSWGQVCAHFGLGPGIFYWRSLFAYDWGGPYGAVYLGFHRYPHRLWNWTYLDWTDAEIINCVNLRFETGWWHLRPLDVVRWRGLGHPFFWSGYGYRHAAFHRPGAVRGGGWSRARARAGARRYRVGRTRVGGGRQRVGRQGGLDRRNGGGGGWNHN